MVISETHLIIDWTCHFTSIVDKFSDSIELIEKTQIPKMLNKKKTMSKFYGCVVDDFRGASAFNIYIIRDNNPIYDYRKTSKGRRRVNIHIFDLKMSLRNIVGGYKIHGTDNIQETKDNLKALDIFDKYYEQKRFSSLGEVFHELNKEPKLKWLVMRNFEKMPDKITIDGHLDVDLLVNDYYIVKSVLDATSATTNRYEDGHNRILNHVFINNKKVLFDFRSIGDNYYDEKFQRDMLNSRQMHPNGFYIPNPEMHLHSLIYHAIVHKTKISQTYLDVFLNYGLNKSEINKTELKRKLNLFMKEKGYVYCKPEPSVGYHI
jgi:hypothetical protein